MVNTSYLPDLIIAAAWIAVTIVLNVRWSHDRLDPSHPGMVGTQKDETESLDPHLR